MIVYWIAYLVPVIGVILPIRLEARALNTVWVLVVVATALMIGCRYEVGGDWDNYLAHYQTVEINGIAGALKLRSLGIGLLNFVSVRFNLGIYGTNTFCALIFAIGLASFCRIQPCPWLAWAIATPYLIIVVAMGYSAQSAALGILFWGFVVLGQGRYLRFTLIVLLAGVFHKTAILMLPLAVLHILNKKRIMLVLGDVRQLVTVGTLLILIGGAVYFFIVERYSDLIQYYISRDQWTSEGAAVRGLMNVVCAIFLLATYRTLSSVVEITNEWIWLAIAALISIFVVGASSTAVDRLSLYIAPLQIYALTRAPFFFSDSFLRSMTVLFIVFMYAVVQWVWLENGTHAHLWIPYKNILFL